MTAGIPGSGIGGLFYLAGALLLPVRTLVRRGRGGSVEWAPVLRQAALALGILAGLWLTGELLGILVGPLLRPAAHGTNAAARHANVLRVVSLLASFGTLGAVLIAVQVAHLVVRRSEARRRGGR